jgi:anti-sigma B factor antagonist
MTMHGASQGAIAILNLSGRFDAHLVPSVNEWIDKTTATAPAKVIVDLSNVHFIDSMALATLVRAMKRCRQQNGDLYLCGLQQPVRIIFELTKLDKAFILFADRDQALHAMTL